jgi:hypothetical protein
LIFIALGVIIFLFSYLGYRTKSKINNLPNPKIEERKLADLPSNDVADLFKKPESVNQQESVNQNPRFEVFTPVSNDDPINKKEKLDKSKLHNPRTLILKK